jgi:hypothetical protein
MIKRLSKSASQGKVPGGNGRETPELPAIPDDKLTGRWAGLIGASFVIAVFAGVLTYFAAGKSGSLAGAALAGGAAFGCALGLLNSIIA